MTNDIGNASQNEDQNLLRFMSSTQEVYLNNRQSFIYIQDLNAKELIRNYVKVKTYFNASGLGFAIAVTALTTLLQAGAFGDFLGISASLWRRIYEFMFFSGIIVSLYNIYHYTRLKLKNNYPSNEDKLIALMKGNDIIKLTSQAKREAKAKKLTDDYKEDMGRNELRIIKATYGYGDKIMDVTEKINKMVTGDRLVVDGKYNEYFGDPAFGRVKNLHVNYRIKGKLYSQTFTENEPISIKTA